jgi:ATP-binding cassette subfamily F protein 3
VVFVSHDRYFIDRLATRVLEVEGGTVTSHEGNYEDYLRRKGLAVGNASGDSSPKESPQQATRTVTVPAPEVAQEDAAGKDRPRRLNPIKQKQMEERCTFLEEETPRIEAAIAHTEEQLGIYVSAAETERLTNLADDLRSQLASLTAEWEDLMMQLDGQAAVS